MSRLYIPPAKETKRQLVYAIPILIICNLIIVPLTVLYFDFMFECIDEELFNIRGLKFALLFCLIPYLWFIIISITVPIYYSMLEYFKPLWPNRIIGMPEGGALGKKWLDPTKTDFSTFFHADDEKLIIRTSLSKIYLYIAVIVLVFNLFPFVKCLQDSPWISIQDLSEAGIYMFLFRHP